VSRTRCARQDTRLGSPRRRTVEGIAIRIDRRHRCAQNDDIPELLTFAQTISCWEDEIVTAAIIGVTNATSESLNRLAKLEAR
jgi:transposase